MTQRRLYLAAYDVADARRLAASLELVAGYALNGQKSVYECQLTAAERGALLHDMALVLDETADRFLLIGLNPRARVHSLGVAAPVADPEFFYLG